MLILLPVGMNYRTERLPVVTFALIGANTLIYLISLICILATQGDAEVWIVNNLWLIPAQSLPWTYLTSMFVHAGILHLVGNMLFLFLFGCCVEDLVGRWKFLIFYLLGGFAAELVYIVMSPEHFASEIPMGGASGAISSCMGMYLLLRANADIEFKYFIWFFAIRAGDFEVPAWVAITCWFLKDLLFAILGMFDHHSGGGVAFGAHVGGLLAGLAIIGIRKAFKPAEKEKPPTSFIPVHAYARAPIDTSPPEIPSIYLHENGAQSGPFTLSQIQTALIHDTISRDAVYWSEGMNDWASISDLASNRL